MPINDKSRFAYNHLISRGLTPVQAAGIVGNLQAESNFDTTVVGKADNMGSIGIAQWHSGRKQNLLNFAKKRGQRYDSLTTQLDFIIEELNSPEYAKAMEGLNNARNPKEAAISFMNNYERPAEWAKKQSVGQRVGVANSILSNTPYEDVTYSDSNSEPGFIPSKFEYGDVPLMMYDNYNALTPEQRAEFNRYTSSAESESTEDVEAVEAKNELAQKENEKNFLDELNSQYQEAQQQEVAPQQQAPVDDSVYRMPQIELPQYQAPEMPEFQTGGFWNTYVDPVISTVTEFFTGDDEEEDKIAQNKKILDTKPTDFASMEKKYDYINRKKSDTLRQNDYIKNNSQRLLLTKGRYRNASINPTIVDEAFKTAKEKNIDPFELLAIIGRESVFGKGYSSREGKQVGKFVETSKKAMASAWNTSEDYRPESPLKFLADKAVPGVKAFSNNQGWFYSIKDEAAMKKHLAENPRLLEQYNQKLKDTKDIKGADSFDMAVDFIKEKGLKNYNPNDPNYQKMVMEDYKVLRSDPVLMNYINKKYNLKDYSKAIYEDGGETDPPVTSRDSVAHQVDKILQYEILRGGPGGAPLDGTNGNPDYNDPVYRKVLMNSIYPQVQKIMPKASAMEVGEAMDFVFNAGWDKDKNKITKDPRAFALQEYYKQYDPSKLDKDGTWAGRKNAPYSFDQEYNNTIGKLPENQRRILMNRGRDWYYQNTAPKGSTWDLKTQGPHPNYSSTWYGRIHNTNDYKPFNPNNPKFTKKEDGGYYQDGGLKFLQPTDPKLPIGGFPKLNLSSEKAISIGGENGEPAYLIPSFKYGQPLDDPLGEFRKTGEHLGGPFKTWQEADKWENETRHPAVEKGENIMFPQQEFKDGGSIPERYRNMGFTRVGAKRQSTRPGKKWMVLAKKGSQYKVVHGGYKGMQDYTQHRSEKRQNRFWDRMGGRSSSKAKDPFSPLYWHKRFGTWEEGGQIGESSDMEDQIEAAIEQGVDPQQIAEQLIQLGLSEEETVQMIQSVMEDMPKSYSKMKMGGEYVEFENGGLGKKVRAQKRKAYRKASEMGLIDPNTSVEKTLMDKMGVRNFQKNAVNNAYEMGISGDHNGGLDAIRHASSAAKVASTMPFGVGFVAANALGAAHEADSKMNWRETASDMYNNFAGSLVGSIPFIDDSTRQNIIIEAQKRGILHNVNQKAPQRREDGGYFTNKDKKTFSDLKNTYPTDKLVNILTYMSNGGTYGVPSYQEGGPEEVVTPNQNIGLVSIQNPDGSISKIRTDSQEYMDLYKSGNLQRGLASENADRETWFDGQLDEVTVVAPPRKKLEGNINLIGSGSTTTSVPEEVETVRDNIVDIQPTLQQKVEKDVAYDKFADKREAKDILEGEKQVKEELSGKIKLEDTLTNQDIDISKYKTKADVMKLQQFLDSKGYNLNPLNKFENAGIDGKLGKVTFGAVTEYNKHLATSGYESIKEGEGLLGKCTEKQCTEYTENEIFRNLQPEIPRQEWNKLTGLYGDTWKIGSNIIKAGGKEVKNQGVSPGDVITIYTGGVSPYQDQANKEGTGDTHSALVDKVNPDGSYYVLHNLHKGSKEKGFEGREYRDLVRGNQIQGHDATLTVRHVYRPNYGKVKLGEKKIVREDLAINVDPKKASTLSTGEYNNFFTSASAKDKLENLFIKPLNDSKNKKVIAKVFGLGDDEYNSLAKSALGVLGQETEYGTNPKYTTGAKKTAANIAKLVGAKNDEVSYGAGQLKYETNFGSDALTELGINQDNFNSEDKASLTTMYKLATDYKGFLKKGYNKKDALYRAITVYNTSLGHVSGGKKVEDWAKEYNVDYTNKVLNFSNMFNVNDNKNSYKTTLDDLLLQKNVAKWNPRLKKLKKI